MERVFGFECGCDACESYGQSLEETEESERRLMKLRRLKERIGGFIEPSGRMTDGRKQVLQTMSLLSREEGLFETAQRLEAVVEQNRIDFS